jgi:pyruvate/2-oxoglutarate dehydrogenase complex dihydrolipoamide acyltransferase (E2) component
MATEIIFPKIGFSMDQALYSLESEKSIQEIESPASGILKIKAEPGVIYKVGEILGEII